MVNLKTLRKWISAQKRCLAAFLAAFAVLLLFTLVVFQPWLSNLDRFQTNGIRWTVYVEDPITSDDVEPLMDVFSHQLKVIFSIDVMSTVFVRMENDNILNYTSDNDHLLEFRDVPPFGMSDIPVYFVTGYRWLVEDNTRRGGWASFNKLGMVICYYFGALWARFLTGEGDGHGNLLTLLHEFGHNMGLPDVYSIKECEGLPVIMARSVIEFEVDNITMLPALAPPLISNNTYIYPSGVTDVQEVYFDRQNNSLMIITYTIGDQGDFNPDGEARLWKYDLNSLRGLWTKEEINHLNLDYDFSYSCPEEVGRFEGPHSSFWLIFLLVGTVLELAVITTLCYSNKRGKMRSQT